MQEIEDCSDEEIKGRVKGPWVFGLYANKEQVRFIVVPDRKATTLIPLVLRYVASGSVIVSDEWPAYRRLPDFSYKHYTVCHKRNFVAPSTGFHTQAIERAWLDAKDWLKRARGAGPLLQSHLDENMWRKYQKSHPDGLLNDFWKDVYKVFE